MSRAGSIRLLVVAVAIAAAGTGLPGGMDRTASGSHRAERGWLQGAWKLMVSGHYTEDILLTLRKCGASQ